MIFRKAQQADLFTISQIYEAIHLQEAAGGCTTGWIQGVYPTLQTAEAALLRGDLFVLEDQSIVGSAIINQQQVDVYAGAPWRNPAPDEAVMVLHTLTIDPNRGRNGYGRAFVQFYEDYARSQGCPYLRMDTNARNLRARAMYQKLGYEEIAIVPCQFNGIPDVKLVLLEKRI